MFLVISYDIPDNRRRLKVSQALEDYGGVRVQYSVFECHLTAAQLAKLRRRLEKVIDAEADSVRFYTLCDNCQARLAFLGRGEPTPEPGLRII